MKKYLGILKAYIWDYRIGILLFGGEALILLCIVIFSNLPQTATAYILFLHCLLYSLAFGLSLWRYSRQTLYLQKILEKTGYLDWKPGQVSLYENHLLELCDQILVKQNGVLQGQEAQVYKNLRNYQEYYTIWVHQIKTPIFALELLLRKNESSQDYSQMKAELLKIKDYTQLALQYIRLESLQGDLEIKSYQLESLIKNQLKKYALLFINQKIKLDLAEFEWKLVTDEKWLAFVLGQILTNALKYTPEGGQIRIYMQATCLIIEDNGLGIRQEDIPRLFQKGFTGGNGRLQKEASGMGLYLAQKVMQVLGYRIWLESEPGQGTKVYLDFDQKEVEDY